MRLQKIPADRFAAFIEARFKATGFKPAAGLGAAIVDLAGNLPYDVQRLAHEVWDDVKAGTEAVGGPRGPARHAEAPARRARYDLRRHVAAADARAARRPSAPPCSKSGHELLSGDVRARHRLSGTSTVQASLAALVREDILAREGARYAVVDSLFREWVARRTF